MTDVHLDATDAMELAELLLFVRNWLARDNHVLAPSLADLIGVDGYHLPEPREDPHPLRLPPWRGPRGVLPQRVMSGGT